jgi:excisionase family DNA binding protein
MGFYYIRKWFTMSTYFEENEDWISQAEAARLRGVSRQAIAKLVRAHRVRTLKIAGKILVLKEDVENYKPLTAGRPKKHEHTI